MRGTPTAAQFSASIKGHQPQPFNPFLFVTLPSRAGAFQSCSPAAPGGFPCHSTPRTWQGEGPQER